MAKQEYDDYQSRAKKLMDTRGKKTFKLVQGDNGFRVLKTPKGEKSDSVFYQFQVHENVGPEKRYLRCGIDPKNGKGRCYLCQVVIPKLRKTGKEARAAALEPKQKLVVQVAKVTDENKIVGVPLLFYPSQRVGDNLVQSIILSKKKDYIDHKRGRNLSINRTGSGKNDTRYGSIESDDDPSKVPDSIIEKLKPFDELESIPKYDEKKMKAAYSGERPDESDADDDDDEKETKKKKKFKKSKDDDDDEDEDDDDDDDDEEEDEEDDDEDEDDEDEDDGDEEEEEDDEEDDDDDDDEDEDDESDRKRSVKKGKKKKSKR